MALIKIPGRAGLVLGFAILIVLQATPATAFGAGNIGH